MQSDMPISIELPRFTIHTLKIMLVISCALSAAYFIVGVLPVDLPRDWWWYSNIHSRSAVTESFLSALFCGAAIYGIHKRTVTAWRLGWVYLGAGYILWLRQCVSFTRTIAPADDTRVAFAATAILGTLITLYWGFWWKKQRGYFKNNPSEQHS
jgi:hypothetical protein